MCSVYEMHDRVAPMQVVSLASQHLSLIVTYHECHQRICSSPPEMCPNAAGIGTCSHRFSLWTLHSYLKNKNKNYRNYGIL